MADGGGAVSVQLTADLVARAIIAAARAYGDDPLLPFEDKAGRRRRVITAAAGGLARAGIVSQVRARAVLGLSEKAIANARARGTPGYLAAEMAAMRAVEFAIGRLEPAHIVGLVWPLPASPAPQDPAPSLAEPAIMREPDVIEIVRSPPAPAARKPRTLTPLAARRAVLEILKLEPRTAPELIEILELSEAQVRQALRELCEEREIRHDALTAEGWRAQTWRMTEAAQP